MADSVCPVCGDRRRLPTASSLTPQQRQPTVGPHINASGAAGSANRVFRPRAKALVAIGALGLALVVALIVGGGNGDEAGSQATRGGVDTASGSTEGASVSASAGSEATSLRCVDGQSVYLCLAVWPDGLTQPVDFNDQSGAVVELADTIDNFGNPYCVTLYSGGGGTFRGGQCASEGASGGGSASDSGSMACTKLYQYAFRGFPAGSSLDEAIDMLYEVAQDFDDEGNSAASSSIVYRVIPIIPMQFAAYSNMAAIYNAYC